MSTVAEVIVAKQVDINCAVTSVVTDECDPENLPLLNIVEIITIAAAANKILTAVLFETIK